MSARRIVLFVLAIAAVILIATRVAGAGVVVHVDHDATGAGTGATWGDAFPLLQDALAIALAGDEIRVAEGTYRPDLGAAWTPGDRDARFVLASGVVLRGGFLGTEAPREGPAGSPTATRLCGELAPGVFARHVVDASGADAGARLEGFAIVRGRDDAFGSRGGGLLVDGGSPWIVDCTFGSDVASDHNYAQCGGAAWIGGGASPTFVRCAFTHGFAVDGGAVAVDGAAPVFVDARFADNTVYQRGGAVVVLGGGVPTFVDCDFVRNDAGGWLGGAIAALDGDPAVVRGRFLANVAAHGGALAATAGSAPLVAGAVFDANFASFEGGAVASFDAAPAFAQCTFTANAAGQGGAVFTTAGGLVPRLVGCILAGDSCFEIACGWGEVSGPAQLDACCAPGLPPGWGGSGNIDADPRFADADGVDDVPGTDDDDLRLAAASPCLDAGDDAALPDDAADLDCDGVRAEPLPLDAQGLPRVFDVVPGTRSDVDMGAFELTGGPDHAPDAWSFVCETGTAGADGAPLLVGEGTLGSGTSLRLLLVGAAPAAPVWLCFGGALLLAPFKGGVLVPDPTPPGACVPAVTDGAGGLVLAGTWPRGIPAGFAVHLQAWVVDGAGPNGFSASVGVTGTAP